MKKIIYLLLISIIFTGCTLNEEASINRSEVKEMTLPKSEASYEKQFSLEEIINLSSNIVIVELMESSDFSDSTNKNIFKIKKNLKGSIEEETIDYYTDSDDFSIGQKYILFMEYFDSVFYENRVYHGVTEFYVVLNDKDEIIEFMVFDKDLSNEYKELLSLEKYIKKVDDGLRTNKSNVASKTIDTDSFDVLATQSDYICEVKPIEIIANNDLVTVARCKITKNYKEKMEDNIIVQLPSNIELEKEYLVFLSKDDGGSYTINSTISLVSKTDEKSYKEALKALNR